MIAIRRDIRVQALQSVALEEMRLPQVTDIIVDAANFVPAGDRPDIADENHQKSDAANSLPVFHLHPAAPVPVATCGNFSVLGSGATSHLAPGLAECPAFKHFRDPQAGA